MDDYLNEVKKVIAYIAVCQFNACTAKGHVILIFEKHRLTSMVQLSAIHQEIILRKRYVTKQFIAQKLNHKVKKLEDNNWQRI